MLDGDEIAVDFAKIAEGYGCKGYTCRTSDELRAALADAKNETRPCLFDIKVLPKTMTPGFESWWRVGVAEVSKSETVAKAYAEMQENIAKTFDY
jgi:3D-(3,5/4)-trihydroxycyclohexane-1,2-dione acylhydrolase (decyclizing)